MQASPGKCVLINHFIGPIFIYLWRAVQFWGLLWAPTNWAIYMPPHWKLFGGELWSRCKAMARRMFQMENPISDEFLLPKQEDILEALKGSQWLSTLDALAEFTQVEVEPKEREKLAFWMHQGLWQFVRMPFGYYNGPSIFQHIMQNGLAPFLWIFTLVYIDDIIIFSLTLEDHISHLDQVLKAIEDSRVKLSVTKWHFGYQSLLLLGQKVSWLGLSTDKEKVDAIHIVPGSTNSFNISSLYRRLRHIVPAANICNSLWAPENIDTHNVKLITHLQLWFNQSRCT